MLINSWSLGSPLTNVCRTSSFNILLLAILDRSPNLWNYLLIVNKWILLCLHLMKTFFILPGDKGFSNRLCSFWQLNWLFSRHHDGNESILFPDLTSKFTSQPLMSMKRIILLLYLISIFRHRNCFTCQLLCVMPSTWTQASLFLFWIFHCTIRTVACWLPKLINHDW